MLSRPYTLAVWSLAAVAAWDASSQPAQAAPSLPATPTPAGDVVVPTTPATPASGSAIAPPETLMAQQFSSTSGDAQTAPVGRYQSVTVPTVTEPAEPSVPPSTRTEQPPTLAQSPPARSPAPTKPPASGSQPGWIVPTTPAPSTAAQAPTSSPSRSPVQPPASSQPRNSSDLAVTVTDVQIVGADSELQQVVRNRIKTQPGRDATQSQLQQDVAVILDTGLFETATYSTRSNPQGLGVTFQVQPIVVRSLQLSGAQALTQSVANDLFKAQLGKTVSPSLLNQSVRQVNEWYAKNGYTLARVLALEPMRDGVVTLEVAEGVVSNVRVRFISPDGKTVDDKGQPIRGRTQEGLIQQQIKLQPGQVFQESTAREDLKRIGQLGVFQTANVTFEGDARQLDVIYNVAEGSARGVNFGGGFNDDLGVYGSVNFQDNNFAGLGQRLGANVQAGTRDFQVDANFRSPYRETDPNTPGYGADFFRRQGFSRVFDDEILLPNGGRVRERRIGGGISLNKPINSEWNGTVGLNYANISLRDRDGNVAKVDAQGNPLSFSGTGVDDLTTVSFTAVRDLRDNSINPTSGSVLSLTTEQSIPLGRGNILGNKLQANYSQYIPLGSQTNRDPQSLPQVLAFNVQGGTFIGDLPPYNAFVLGGPNSVRGYQTGDVATSRSFVQASAEYRFPIYKFIGGVAFADFASDLGTSSEVLGEPGVDRGKPGTGFGYGAGLRINSPIGIIRADFGLNDQGESRFQFGFGQRF